MCKGMGFGMMGSQWAPVLGTCNRHYHSCSHNQQTNAQLDAAYATCMHQQELKELISSYQGMRDGGRAPAICATIIETARQCNLDKVRLRVSCLQYPPSPPAHHSKQLEGNVSPHYYYWGPSSAVLCCAVLCCAVLCCAVLCCRTWLCRMRTPRTSPWTTATSLWATCTGRGGEGEGGR
jgi:hypothetical protein